MLAGLISFYGLQVNNAPDIDFPAATVSVSQPGAAPNEIETQITQRVESAVRGVTGVEEINSSVREGNSFTFVQFQIGTSTDRAVNDVFGDDTFVPTDHLRSLLFIAASYADEENRAVFTVAEALVDEHGHRRGPGARRRPVALRPRLPAPVREERLRQEAGRELQRAAALFALLSFGPRAALLVRVIRRRGPDLGSDLDVIQVHKSRRELLALVIDDRE